VPLYFILYDISFSQFAYSDTATSDSAKQLVDHSIPTRSHAQYISSQIHDEASHCSHRFTDYSVLSKMLISKRGELADIEYATTRSADTSNMPNGFDTQEAYLFN